MTIYVRAYEPGDSIREKASLEEKLFFDNLPLILDHAQIIVENREYFFCPLAFCWCSLLWIAGGGPLCLGHLLLGWSAGVLTEPCSDCNGRVLVTSFGGSPLSGSNSWSGYCVGCRCKKAGNDSVHKPFTKRAGFAASVRKTYPTQISTWEEFDGFDFSWGGNGLQPSRKKRLVVHRTADAVDLETLINELKSGKLRKGSPPDRLDIETPIQLEINQR
jgi:hypothetical protein